MGSGGVCAGHHDGHHDLEGAAALGEEILHQSAPLWVSYSDVSTVSLIEVLSNSFDPPGVYKIRLGGSDQLTNLCPG